jgi:hypothetical protein
MAHLADTFPYSENEAGESYIFSALDCECTRDLFLIAEQQGIISPNYRTTLLSNLYTYKDSTPKPDYWVVV